MKPKLVRSVLAILVIIGLSLESGTGATKYVLVVDLSGSAKTVLPQYQNSVHNLLSSSEMPLDIHDHVVIIGITEDSFGYPKLLVSHTIQPLKTDGLHLSDCSKLAMGSLQRKACETRNKAKTREFDHLRAGHYKNQREHLIALWDRCNLEATSPKTDILGGLKYTEQIFGTWKGEKRLFIYSDMRHTARGVHLVNRLRNESGLLAELKRRQLLPRLKGVSITIRGVHTRAMSPDDYGRLEDFWKRFFDETGAKLIEFAIDSSS